MKFSNTRSLGFDTALHFWFRYVATLVSIRPSVYSTRRLLNPAPRLLNRRSLKYNGQMVYRQNMDKDKFRKGWLWGIYQPILTVCLVSIIVFLSGCGDKVSVPQPSDFELVSEPRLLQTIKNAQKAVVKNSKSAADWVRLGHVYLIHNWRDEASQCYRHAAELEPNEFRWFYYLGRSLEEIA
nr:hypothetical protein [bacterium]